MILLALACASASAGGSSPKGDDDDAQGGGWTEVECEVCAWDGNGAPTNFCFAMEEPRPFVAFEGTTGGTWFPLPQESVNASLTDGEMSLEAIGVRDGICVAFVAE